MSLKDMAAACAWSADVTLLVLVSCLIPVCCRPPHTRRRLRRLFRRATWRRLDKLRSVSRFRWFRRCRLLRHRRPHVLMSSLVLNRARSLIRLLLHPKNVVCSFGASVRLPSMFNDPTHPLIYLQAIKRAHSEKVLRLQVGCRLLACRSANQLRGCCCYR